MSPTSKKGSFMNVEIAQRLAAMRREGIQPGGAGRTARPVAAGGVEVESAESSPDTGNLIALAKLYGVSIDDLLRIDDDVADDVAFEEKRQGRHRRGAGAGGRHLRANEAAVRAAQVSAAAHLERRPNRHQASGAAPTAAPASARAAALPQRASCPSSLRNPRSRKRLYAPASPASPRVPTTPSRAARAAWSTFVSRALRARVPGRRLPAGVVASRLVRLPHHPVVLLDRPHHRKRPELSGELTPAEGPHHDETHDGVVRQNHAHHRAQLAHPGVHRIRRMLGHALRNAGRNGNGIGERGRGQRQEPQR